MSYLMQARFATEPVDLHRDKLVGLVNRCWSTKTFPDPEQFRAAVSAICDDVRRQVCRDGVQADERERLARVVRLLRAANESRQGDP